MLYNQLQYYLFHYLTVGLVALLCLLSFFFRFHTEAGTSQMPCREPLISLTVSSDEDIITKWLLVHWRMQGSTELEAQAQSSQSDHDVSRMIGKQNNIVSS